MKRVLVLGATGDQGHPLLTRLSAVGLVPVAALRNTSALANTEFAAVETVRADLYDQHSMSAAAQGMDAIVAHLPFVFDLELASKLGAFPPGWTAAADLLPAEGWVAGDCYDVTLVSPHVLGIIVIDIAGHGAPQAIMALRCKEILRAALRMNLEPGAALGLLAEQVGDLHPSFVTAFVALVDTTTGACRYANAGHPPALLAGHDNVVHSLSPTGPLLGVFDASWSTAVATVGAGAKLAVYTDGLTEARDHAEEFYGMERLASLVVTLPCEVAESVIKACFDDLRVFRPSRLSDDVTMVLVCRECESS